MSTLSTIKSRSSSRKYLTTPVPRDIVEKIVEAGTYAATGRGMQAPIILAVMNKDVRDRLSKINAQIMGVDSDPFYGAPQVLVVLAEKKAHTYIYDGSLVLGNMMLAAEELGIASCWIHRAKETFETEEGKQILADAGIEGDYEGIGNLIIGYDDGGKREKAPRKANYVTWIE